MNLSLSLNDIYGLLAGLSADNKKWLAERLTVDAANDEAKAQGIVFPHVPSGRAVSREVLGMVVGTLPEGFSAEKETDKMWEDFAR